MRNVIGALILGTLVLASARARTACARTMHWLWSLRNKPRIPPEAAAAAGLVIGKAQQSASAASDSIKRAGNTT